MCIKRKDEAYRIFYKEFNMLDKFLYIKKVMFSCKTKTQLDIAYKWGNDVLNNNLKQFIKKYDGCSFSKWLNYFDYFSTRTSILVNQLHTYNDELSGKVYQNV